MQVLISTSSFGKHSREPLDLLEEHGIGFRMNAKGRKLQEEEIATLLGDIDGLIAGTEPLTRAVLQRAPRLRVISRVGTGIDNIDLEAASEFGIEVRNTPDAHVDAVAEMTLGAMLSSLRHLGRADRAVRSGEWSKPMGRLLRGKTIGLVGLGRVGRRLMELLQPFEVQVLASDPRRDPQLVDAGVLYLDLEELLSRADVVSLHLPYSEAVHHLIDEERLGRMKRDGVLVNCARGGIVDESALAAALQAGQLGAAHVDTFEREPYEGPLTNIPDITLSPHIGSYAVEGRVRMEREAVENLLSCLGNGDRA